MISTIIIHPNIFNLENLDKQEKCSYLKHLFAWCKFCRPKNSIIILDKQNKLEKEIHAFINKEQKIELKKQLIAIWQYINTNISRSKLSSRQFTLIDNCECCFRLVDKSQPETVLARDGICIGKHCKTCFVELINNNLNIQYSNEPNTWVDINNNYSDIPEKHNFDSFINYTKFKNLIKHCKDFTLYDKNIIPEDTNIISENYKYNLNNFMQLFKGFNVKKTQLQQSENNIKQTISIINGLAKSNNIPLTLKVLIGENENNQYMEQIHNRYIFTNLANYSTDRGLDIINKTTGLNRSFDINIIDNEKAELFQNYLNSLKKY